MTASHDIEELSIESEELGRGESASDFTSHNRFSDKRRRRKKDF